MKVWISKYALTDGIVEREVEECDANGRYVYSKADFWQSFRLGGDAHKTREAAVAAANSMRLEKIASLKKQIEKLEALDFSAR